MDKIINIVNDCRDMFPEEIVETILESKGIKDVDAYFNPKESDLIYPFELKNMKRAVDLTINYLQNNNHAIVYFDTDNDGISSGTIVYKYLESIGFECEWFINHGKSHGITKEFFEFIKDKEPCLLIVVDSLDGDEKNYEIIKNRGFEIIVLDHHNISSDVPYDDVVCLVSSQRAYSNPALSGSGVCYKYVLALEEMIGTTNAHEFECLAASGIISDMCDVSINSPENRYIVKNGLSNIQNKALKQMGGGFEFNSTTIAFSVAPKVNASNRMDKNEIAVETMLSDDLDSLKANSKKLNKIKTEQDKEAERLLPDAIEQCENQKDNNMLVVVVDTEYGINGLLGNKLLSIYQKPILVLKELDYKYAGSMRATGVKDFSEMCVSTGLCECHGHENAAGIEIAYSDFDAFREQIEEKLSEIEFANEYNIDAVLNLSDVNNSLIDKVKECDFISGMNDPQLKFIIEIDDYEIGDFSKRKHLVLKCQNMIFIKWNFQGDWDELEDAAMFNTPIKCICTLTSGFIGRSYYIQGILEDFIIGDE